MKNISKYFILAIFGGLLFSCEENELPQLDPEIEAVQFEEESKTVTVPNDEDVTVLIPISVTNTSSQDRTFSLVVDESSTAVPGSYSIGTAVIFANSYLGTVNVALSSEGLEDGELYELILNLEPREDGITLGEGVSIFYNKEVICNDYVVQIITDQYPEETSWDIKDSEGNIVASGPEVPYGPESSVESRGKIYNTNVSLEDGCYTFTIYDSYGDGQSDGVYEGGYKVFCSIITAASGTGSFGASEKTEFCVNQ